MPGVHATGGAIECVFNLEVWDRISESDREMIKLAGKLMAMDSWARYAYRDIGALKEMREFGNEFVLLDSEFIRISREATKRWENEEAERNPWFKRALDHRRAFEKEMNNWPSFRFPIGQR